MKISPKLVVAVVGLAILLLAGTTWAMAQDNPMALNDLTCTAGQIAKFDGTVWACSDDLATLKAQLEAVQLKVDPEAEFKKVVFAVEEAMKAADVDRLMEFYADDVVTMLPGLPPLRGKEEVRADWENFFNAYTLNRDARLVYTDVSGDSAVRRMEWTNTLTPKGGSEPIVDTGTCVVGFKKIGGEWKIVWEIASVFE
jgi:ketosteroid isomerase-like protein